MPLFLVYFSYFCPFTLSITVIQLYIGVIRPSSFAEVFLHLLIAWGSVVSGKVSGVPSLEGCLAALAVFS
jgi:hypothetical protein